MSAQNCIQLNSAYRFQWEQAQQCYVLLYPEGLVKLSDSAAEILKRCSDATTVEALIDSLRADFNDAEGLAEDVIEFLQDAREQGWIIDVDS